jgi:hypothetical protein
VLAIRPPCVAISPSRTSRRSKGIKGGNLIGPHEAAVTLNVSRKDCSQSALDFGGSAKGNPSACGFRGRTLIRSG